MFPYITSKAFFFRIMVEAALPFYIYILFSNKLARPNLKNPLTIAVLVFLVINVISSFFGVNVSRSLWGNYERMGGTYYLVHLTVLYFYVQVIGVLGENYLKRFLQAFIALATLVTLNGLSGWVDGPTVVLDPSLPDRVSSTFGNPIFFASYLIVPMFLALYFAFDEDVLWKRISYGVICFLQFLGIYSSGTRGALVGLVIGLFIGSVIYLLTTPSKQTKKYGFGFVGAIILVIGLLFSFQNKTTGTLRRLTHLKDSNTSARLIQWKIAIEGTKKYFLSGTGPENYYIVANKFYNTELYKYDPSWFDKPHNYVLEVLVTTGIFGLISYITIFVLSLWGLWKTYKAGIISAGSFSIFVAAVVSYQIQNIFVFDTVSASIAFFGFSGLIAFLYNESTVVEAKNVIQNIDSTAGNIALWVSAPIMVYVIFVSNIFSMTASAKANYGYAYRDANPELAAQYFEAGLHIDTNLDKREYANRYSSYGAALAVSGYADKNPEFAKEQIEKATENQRKVTNAVGNDPLLWLSLANAEMFNDIIHKQTISDRAEKAIDKAIELAPKRVELLQFYLQLYGYQQDYGKLVEVAKRMIEFDPTRPEFKWQLALAQYLSGNIPEAVKAGDAARSEGYEFTRLREFAWYIQYYEDKGDFTTAAPLLEKAIDLEPSEISLYTHLVDVYKTLGENEKAIALAQRIIVIDPSQRASMEQLIQVLQK